MQGSPYIEVQLHEMMKKRKIRTIGEVSRKSGLSRKAVSAALNNDRHRMKSDTIARLCNALECEVGELLVVRKEAN